MNQAAAAQETLALMKASQASPDAELLKAWNQSGSAITGITAYDLEAPAKKLYPVITPLRNRIPRVSGKGGIQANWRAVTAINTGSISAGVGQGNRGGVIATTTANYSAAYAGLGLEDYATFEADYAAEGFDDVKALAVEGLLRSLMIQEERIILGGNNSLALGTTPTPSVTAFITGGAMAAATYNVFCVALTLDGVLNSSVAGGIVGQVVRTNADGSSDTYGGGAAQKSVSAAGVVASGTTGSLQVSTAAVAGAFGYAWFWGTAGTEKLGAITYVNSYLVTTAVATGTQTIASVTAADYSQNGLVFDGLLTQVNKGLGSYVKVMATGTPGTGTPLTADGVGGVVEIDTGLQYFWDTYRLSPTAIWVNSQQQKDLSAKILAGNANGAQRFVFNADQGMMAGGTMVRSYLNKFSMNGAQEIPILLHPNLPSGTILFYCDQLPYPLSNVSNVLQIRSRREYYQIEWPLRSRKYEYGVYADEVLQNYFPPSFGIITNIAPG